MERFKHKYGEVLRGGTFREFKIIALLRNDTHKVLFCDRYGLVDFKREYDNPFENTYKSFRVLRNVRGVFSLWAEFNQPKYAL